MGDATMAVASAMNTHIIAQEVAARNVANVATAGFKRNVVLVEASEENGGTAPGIVSVGVDLSDGAYRATHSRFDLALKGPGFFTIAGEENLRYTRNGSFRLDENRLLVTQDRRPVLGESGEIQAPSGAAEITVTRNGNVRADGTSIGKLQLTDFERPEMLKQAGACEFIEAGAGARPAAGCEVRQGFLEQSNVNPVMELVRMIAVFRDFEACARSVRSLEDSARKLYSWVMS